MTDKLALAEQIERAVASEQRQWLEQAFYELNPAPEGYGEVRIPWVNASNRFRRMLDAEAYESAAMTLVPEGWGRIEYGRYEDTPDRYWAQISGFDKLAASENCATPALALCAAALRAGGTDAE